MQVYKGRLSDGTVALVKCLKLKQKHIVQSLIQSIEDSLSKLRHRHMVSVLGHCIVTYQDHPNTATTVFVVLENVTKSLSDYVTGKGSEPYKIFKLKFQMLKSFSQQHFWQIGERKRC